MQFLNTAAYRFVEIEDPRALKSPLLERAGRLGLRGTILLSEEGVNLMLCGTPDAIGGMKATLDLYPAFAGMEYRDSPSGFLPFDRIKVRIRDEIITLGDDEIRPRQFTGPRIEPESLRRWLDEEREFTLLDTRNDYETLLGTFERALTLDIGSFREFPRAVTALDPGARTRPLVMFCTGGVRCEKASALMLKSGFREVYQLDGGILNYFARCGGAHWKGECFVFDQRVGVTPRLAPTRTRLCVRCQKPLPDGRNCPHCQRVGPGIGAPARAGYRSMARTDCTPAGAPLKDLE